MSLGAEKVAWQKPRLLKVTLVSGVSIQLSHVRDCQLIRRLAGVNNVFK
jgi:hypothetical protein